MSLDFGFYAQDDIEVVGFRGHGDLFDFFTTQPTLEVITENEDHDFYVTEDLLRTVIADIEQKMRDESQSLYPLLDCGPEVVSAVAAAIPEQFFLWPPKDWIAVLPVYRVLMTALLIRVQQTGPLVCHWST